MTQLKGKTALITGSTSGIGLGIAQCFADKGINIVLNGFGPAAEVEKIRKDIESKGVQCIYNGADMTKPTEIELMINEAKDIFGTIDILINNAGIQHVSPVEDFPPVKWEAIMSINLSSAFYTTHYTVPLMKKAGWGRIINMASAHGLVASPFKSAYVAAKHGIVGFTKSVALELAENNITVNAICPGYVETPLVEGQIADTAKARKMSKEQVINDVLLKAQWTKKFVTIEQVSDLALFLCSDSAQNITGSAQSIDGGWTAA